MNLHDYREEDGAKEVWLEYECDGVLTEQRWRFQKVDERDSLDMFYDCFFMMKNADDVKKKDYLQLFACYLVYGTSYCWSSDDNTIPCPSDDFSGVRDRKEKRELTAKTSPYSAHFKRYS